MSISNFDELLTSLQDVQDKTKLLKILIDIRKGVDVDCYKNKENIARIQKKGAFKHIVASLQTSKKGVINISLSILGNCCLDAKCARDVVSQYGALSGLNQLLKRYPKGDSINGRVFRIIGNLCQHKDQWANTIIDKKPQIVIQTVQYLKNSVEDDAEVSEATITMGLRALRELLNQETLKTLVTTYGVLKTVGMLLIKYGAIWKETKKGENVLINIIKLLHKYSRYRYYPSIQEMRTTEKGDSIIYLSKILLVAPRQVVKIVMNFLRMSQLKSDLPVPEIFDSFIGILSDDTIIQEFNSTCTECIKCLCYLLSHPGNRENERCGDSIPLLINVLKGLTFQNNNKIECSLLIIATLNKCKYNFSLIADQIKCNAISVLNEKLNLIVGSGELLNMSHEKKEKLTPFARFIGDYNIEGESTSSSNSDEDDPMCSNNVRYDFSPSSSNDSEMAMSWTSGLSPSSSPRSQGYGISESDSDDYSPVCSEVDPTEFPLPKVEGTESPNLEIESKNSDDVLEGSEDLQGFDLDSSNDKEIKRKIVTEVINLLKTYVKVQPPVADLGTPELLLGLVKTAMYFDMRSSPPGILDVINRILESHNYLIPLMQSDFIPAVYDLLEVEHGLSCQKCNQFHRIGVSIIKKLSEVAESGGGKGDIAHKLLRGDTATKQQIVLVIPYIIRNRATLMKLMLNCGGLEILMKLLKDQSHLQNKGIKVLCVLALDRLGIPHPKKVLGCYKTRIGNISLEDSSTLVTFKLDDGTQLSADRELLSRSSDFFARLLNGDFKESTQDVIALPNVTNKALKCLLYLLKCDIIKTDLMDIDVDLNTHLDVIGLCDRFLLEHYRVYLTDCVVKFRLSRDAIPTIYNWSLESGTNLLRVECIAFALVDYITDSKRFELFRSLFDLGYTEELVEDIRQLLVRYLSINQFCDCKKRKCCGKKLF